MAILPSRRAFVSGAATSLLVPLGQASGASAGSIGAEPPSESFLRPGAGAVARTIESKVGDIISVKDFGASGDGVRDDTAAFQAAIDVGTSYANTCTSIYIPPGKYRITNTIRLNKNKIRLFGAGDKSCLYFDPPATDRTMILVQAANPADLINYIDLESFAFIASPASSAHTKTGIKLIDASIVTIRNVNTLDYSWTSGTAPGTSIAVHMCGRDTHTFEKCTWAADKPIYADKNPNSTTFQFDFHHFSGVWLQPLLAGGYGITFAPGVNPSNWIVDGNSGSFSGDGGIYLDNTGVTTEAPSMIVIDGFRCEGGRANGVGVGGGYGIYMNFGARGVNNPGCGNIHIRNCSINDPTCHGIWLKNVNALIVDNVNCGFGATNNAFILTDVLNANIRLLGIGHPSATVTLDNMYAQRLHKMASDSTPTGKSIAWGIYSYYDSDTPSRNLVYRNGVRSWQRSEALRNHGEMVLPALAVGGSMLVFVSSGLGGAVYAVTHTSSFLLNATPGWEAAIGIVSDGAGNSRLVNRSAGPQIFTVNTNGT